MLVLATRFLVLKEVLVALGTSFLVLALVINYRSLMILLATPEY